MQVLRLEVDPIQEDNYLGSIVHWQRLNVELQVVEASYLIMRDRTTRIHPDNSLYTLHKSVVSVIFCEVAFLILLIFNAE